MRSGQNPLGLPHRAWRFCRHSGSSAFLHSGVPAGQRLPVVLLQRPRYLPKSGSQHFSRELRCPDRKGNRFWFTSSCIKPPFRQGSRYPGGPVQSRGTENLGPMWPEASLGISAGRSFLFRLRLDFFALFPHGLQDRGLLLKLGGLFAGQRLDTFRRSAARMALSVSCLCHAPTLGAQRKPLLFNSARVSASGFPSKNTCKRLSSRFISHGPRRTPSRKTPAAPVWRAVRYASLPGGSPHCCW